MVNTPVLFETFARPDYARQSFEAIKKARPRILYFYSNKARTDHPDEVQRNEMVRGLVNEIDWECDLHTFFRDEYVDVFTSLWGSLDWFFSNVEEGIVLEEDCVASVAFFDFCDKLLPKYRSNKQIRLISGDNFTPEFNPTGMDYFYTKYMHIYGWASWRDRWFSMDRTMSNWQENKNVKLKNYYNHHLPIIYYKFMLNKVYNNMNNYNSWDYITLYNMIWNNDYAVMPSQNLVDNIGNVGVNTTVNANYKLLDTYKNDIYPTDNYPLDIKTFDSYDYRHFKKHILLGLIKYECRKIAFSLLKIIHIR